MGNCDFKADNSGTGSSNLISKSNFQKEYPIGNGGYGKVWKCKHKTDGRVFALKEMEKSLVIAKKSVSNVNFEKELLTKLKHDFIVNICYATQDEEKLYMILELSSGSDLRYHLYKNKVFNEVEASK